MRVPSCRVRVLTATVTLALLAGCATTGTTPSPPPAAAAPTSPAAPPRSPAQRWVDRICVTELMNAPGAELARPPTLAADDLASGTRRLTQWADTVEAAATAMLAKLDEIGPPPSGSGLEAAHADYRKAFENVASLEGAVAATAAGATGEAELETATDIAALVGISMLGAQTALGQPPFRALTADNPLCL